jgi:hypothetical protein
MFLLYAGMRAHNAGLCCRQRGANCIGRATPSVPCFHHFSAPTGVLCLRLSLLPLSLLRKELQPMKVRGTTSSHGMGVEWRVGTYVAVLVPVGGGRPRNVCVFQHGAHHLGVFHLSTIHTPRLIPMHVCTLSSNTPLTLPAPSLFFLVVVPFLAFVARVTLPPCIRSPLHSQPPIASQRIATRIHSQVRQCARAVMDKYSSRLAMHSAPG